MSTYISELLYDLCDVNLEDQIIILLAKIETLTNRLEKVEHENKQLRRRLNMDSSNSSKPPSSDSIFKRPDRQYPQKQLRKSNKKPGGQPGHKGNHLTKFEQVDFYEDHYMESCPLCDSSSLEIVDDRIKQVVDIPAPKIEITEHYVYRYQCRHCGHVSNSDQYDQLKQEVQYGPRIKALVSYLNVYQLVPYKRLTQLIEDLYGHKISQGSISNFNKSLSSQLSDFISQLKDSLVGKDQVVHSDETGCLVSKDLHWMHVYSDASKTLLEGHKKRGKQAMDEIGVLPQAQGTIVHDRYTSYSSYKQVEHALCNAHIVRELKSIEEQISWAGEIKKCLLQAKHYKDTQALTTVRITKLQTEYDKILRRQRRHYQQIEASLKLKKNRKGRLKRSTDHNLFNALQKSTHEVLKFMYVKEVPFDNNQAERDLRMLKVKMKISNQFKTPEWMNVHANIRSYISTVHKQHKNILEYLNIALVDPIKAAQLAV